MKTTDASYLSIEELAAKIEKSVFTVDKWLRAFKMRGIEGLKRKKRDRTTYDKVREIKSRRVFETTSV